MDSLLAQEILKRLDLLDGKIDRMSDRLEARIVPIEEHVHSMQTGGRVVLAILAGITAVLTLVVGFLKYLRGA